MPSLRGAYTLETYEAVILEYLWRKHIAYHAFNIEWYIDAFSVTHGTITFHTTDEMRPARIHRLQHAIEEVFARYHRIAVRIHCTIQVESPAEATLCQV